MPSILIGSFMAKNNFNPRAQIAIGGGIGISGAFTSSFAKTLPGFIAIFCIPFGIATGLTYSVPLNIAWMYFPNRIGVISGLIVAGFGLGGLIFGLVSTRYVNPDSVDSNIEKEEKLLPEDYEYTPFDEEIFMRVPSLLRRLSLLWLIIMILSVLLIQDPPQKYQGDVRTKNKS